LSETSLSRHRPSVHLVTPAIVERTVARRGVFALLAPAERETLEGLVLEKRRRDWVAGRLAAKRAVRRACRTAGEAVPGHAAIDIRNEADGAPAFSVREQPWLAERFNLSIAHSDGAAVAAIAETATGRVGVDLEVTKSLDLELVRRVLNAHELARLDDSRSPHPAPLVLWTAKEAAMKAAHHACDALRDVELSWRSSGAMSARLVARAPSPMIRVRHRVVGPYTVAVALCRMNGHDV
jgi:phosphopantetheinyl transferase (holo-ACP synthase)